MRKEGGWSMHFWGRFVSRYSVRQRAGWPSGWIILPSHHSGMHPLVMYHSINTSTDLPKN